ncbi:MAG TPA: response regulator, partial [Chryseosolibacter sp.]|nr:response regulator [Chryseosolibacter sp.]
FHEDRSGNLWIATEHSGFIRTDPSLSSIKLYSTATHPLTNDAITDIDADHTGKLWLSTWNGGVMTFDPRTEKIRTLLNSRSNVNTLPINDAKSLLADDTLVWIGTHGEGVAAYDLKRNTVIHHGNNKVFPFDMWQPGWINFLFKDSKKQLWIATYSGLFMFNGKVLEHFENTVDTTSLSSNSVNMVAEDQMGRIWIVSEAGLDLWQPSERNFTRYRAKLRLPAIMKSIVVDHHNNLWIATNEGIVTVDTKAPSVRRYDANDGLQGNSFFQKAAWRGSKGQVYFGGPKGINVFHPDSLPPRTYVPGRFYFSNLFIDNKPQLPGMKESPLKKVLAFTDEIVLTPNQSFFSVEITAVNLYAPLKTQYAYKLKGMQDNWIDLGTERKISFTNLDPGTYHLQVKFRDVNGEWQQPSTTLKIVVLPPWYKTPSFKILVVVLVAAVVSGIFYARISAIRERARMLKSEVEKRTSELREANTFLTEKNDEIRIQKERLETYNREILRQSRQIMDQKQHISEQNRQLEVTIEELQKLNKTKDHFFSILAHDLKNPIAALTGISDFMKTNLARLDKKQTIEYVNSIHRSSNAIYELLINLLNWSTTQSGSLECVPVHVNVMEVIRKNIALLEQQFNNKHIRVDLKSEPGHTAFADYNMLDSILRNIIGNAVKFTPYNGLVSISTSLHGDKVDITISDNGVGMTQLQLQNLFSLNKDCVSVGTAGEKGTGLGLVIAYEFTKANQGDIRVSSEPGTSTSFVITLAGSRQRVHPGPLHNDKGSGALNVADTLASEKVTKLKGKKILIVDDNTELRTYLRLLLAGIFEIHEAPNGEAGLQVALDIQPVAIVTDLMMPVMNGLDLCDEIKRNPSTCHIPVILLTSQWDEQHQLSGYEAGADIYLTKPVRKEVFIQVVMNLIGHQEKVREKIHACILSETEFQKEHLSINGLDEEFLKRVVVCIEQNISDASIDARTICNEVGMSRTVLYAKIKSLTGQSVHEFIKGIRLKHSLRLLMAGRLTINQVAIEVGFSSHSYFDKCFIKQYGMGPKEYVAKQRALKIG